ncbi:MAG: tape measure protein [Reyranellaceae bacterium]
MADEVKLIRIVVDSSKAVDGSAAATRALKNLEQSQTSMTSAMQSMEERFTSLGRVLAGYLGARQIIELSDAFTKFSNSLKATGDSASTLTAVADRLFSAANKNGVEITALSQLYNRAAMSGKELGASQEKLLEFVDGVTAALRLQGGSTEQAQGALLQLSQALGSGTVRAEEFNSVLEGALPIAQAAARGMDGMGGSVAKLRAAVVEGQVSSKQFFDALLKGFDETRASAATQSLTIGAAWTSMRNAMTRYVGEAGEASGATRALADAMEGISTKIDNWSKKLSTNDDMLQFSKMIESTRKEVEMLGNLFEKIDKWGTGTGFWDGVRGGLEELGVWAARGAAGFLEAFRQLPDQLGKIFIDAMNAAIRALSSGLTTINDTIADAAPWLGVKKGSVPTSLIPGGGASLGSVFSAMGTAADQEEARVRAANAAAAAQRERARLLDRQAGMETDETRARRGALMTGALGFGTSMPSKADADAAKRYAELEQQLSNTAAAQDKMTAAARAGGQAFEEAKAQVDAQNKMLDIFKKQLDESDPRLVKIRDKLLQIAQGKVAEAFAVQTTELQKQNVILQAQIDLMGKAPEIQAAEIALIKAKQDAEKAGSAITAADLEARRQAIETNERLKLQQQQLAQEQEMWTEPLKQALRDIQTAGANAFEQMLDSGRLSFQSLGDTFSKIIKKMIAEFLALATIRPVMSVMVNAIGSTGILPQSAISSMGYGGSLSPTGGSSGGGLGGMWGTGGGSMFGGLGDWLNTPFTGPYAGMSPSSMVGVPTLSPSLMSPSSWGITPLQGIGAAAGIGGGIYQLLSGGGSTSSMIGGISSMIGGGVSLIPGVGQIAGPLIALAGNLLGGLFGGQREPTITNQAYGQLAYGAGGFGTSGGAWGPSANAGALQGQLGQAGSSIQGIFDSLGGVKDSGKVWGVALQSFSQQYGRNGSFSNQTSFLVDPSGNKTQWGMGSTAQDVGLDAASAQVAIRSIIGGAVGEITDSMRTALTTVGNRTGGGSLAEVGQAVVFVKAYDALGKSTTEAQKALDAITASFADMKTGATALGLSLDPINAELEKQRQAYATGFADSLGRELDPTGYALKDLDAWRTKMKEENQYILDNVAGSLDQIANIEKVYGQRRAAIVEQAAQGSVSALEDIVKRLTYGDLSGASPESTLSGTAGTYQALLAKAKAGDASALAQIGGAATDYAQAARAMYASSVDYENIRSGIVTDLSGLALGNGGSPSDFNAQAAQTVSQQISFLTAAVAQATNDNAALRAQLEEAINLWQRLVNK